MKFVSRVTLSAVCTQAFRPVPVHKLNTMLGPQDAPVMSDTQPDILDTQPVVAPVDRSQRRITEWFTEAGIKGAGRAGAAGARAGIQIHTSRTKWRVFKLRDLQH